MTTPGEPELSEPLELALLAPFRAPGREAVFRPDTAPSSSGLTADGALFASARVVGVGDGATVILLQPRLNLELLLCEAVSIAESCFGVSASRFQNLLPRLPAPEAIAELLRSIALSNDASLPPPSLERAISVLSLLRRRNRQATLHLRLLEADLRFHTADSRDLRTGSWPGPVAHSHSPGLMTRSLRPETVVQAAGFRLRAVLAPASEVAHLLQAVMARQATQMAATLGFLVDLILAAEGEAMFT